MKSCFVGYSPSTGFKPVEVRVLIEAGFMPVEVMML